VTIFNISQAHGISICNNKGVNFLHRWSINIPRPIMSRFICLSPPANSAHYKEFLGQAHAWSVARWYFWLLVKWQTLGLGWRKPDCGWRRIETLTLTEASILIELIEVCLSLPVTISTTIDIATLLDKLQAWIFYHHGYYRLIIYCINRLLRTAGARTDIGRERWLTERLRAQACTKCAYTQSSRGYWNLQ